MEGWLRAVLCIAVSLGTAAGVRAQGSTDIQVLEIMVRNDQVLVVGAPRALTDRAGYDNQPAFTPDGASVLYTSIRNGQADSWRHDLGRGTGERVTETPESEYSPTPIPGTDRFSVVRVEADSAQRLWSFGPDGTAPRLLLAGVAPVGYHAWTADGRVAVFVLGDPPTLRLANPRTGRAWVVARDIGRSMQSVPGRNAVTFTQRIGDRWWIRELDLDARLIRPVAPLPGEEGYHAWTPGGALLTADGTAIYQWRDVGTGEWRRIADVAESGLGAVTRLAVAPDGRLLAVVVERIETP